MDVQVLVLAAGRSTRMKSARNKLLHDLRGVPILARTLRNVSEMGPVSCVVGAAATEIAALAKSLGASTVVQDPPLGTGHALIAATEQFKGAKGDLIIVNGDVPLARVEVFRRLVEFHRAQRSTLTVVSTEPPDPGAYGRMIRKGTRLMAIREFVDAPEKIRRSREINAGIYCVRMPEIFRHLKKLRPDNQKGEYYITDLVGILNRAGRKVCCLFDPSWRELLGINDLVDMEEAAAALNERKIRELQSEGVAILSSHMTVIGDEVRIGADTIVHPFTSVEGRTTIGSACRILPFTRIVDSTIEDGVEILGSSFIVDSHIEAGSTAGPFCHLRGNTRILRESKVGNFVEMKKTAFGPKSKAMHLSYLGDATIESGVNIGAGTITCNYDGVNKNPTHIEAGVFIGSGTELVAPVRVGQDAYVAAGSTITENVPSGSLAIARARQVTKEGWVEQRRESRKSGK